jgi:hypothetical protein
MRVLLTCLVMVILIVGSPLSVGAQGRYATDAEIENFVNGVVNRTLASGLPTPPAAATSQPKGTTGGVQVGLVWREAERYSSTISGIWRLNPNTRQFQASWQNGAQATLRLEQLNAQQVVVTRYDQSGSSAGLSARYVGRLNPNGRGVSGTVTWNWKGRTWNGVWEASW